MENNNDNKIIDFIKIGSELILSNYYYKFNEKLARENIIKKIDNMIKSIEFDKPIYEFKIVCDESNNSPEVINASMLIIDIYITEIITNITKVLRTTRI